jgi:hypothetical protein
VLNSKEYNGVNIFQGVRGLRMASCIPEQGCHRRKYLQIGKGGEKKKSLKPSTVQSQPQQGSTKRTADALACQHPALPELLIWNHF